MSCHINTSSLTFKAPSTEGMTFQAYSDVGELYCQDLSLDEIRFKPMEISAIKFCSYILLSALAFSEIYDQGYFNTCMEIVTDIFVYFPTNWFATYFTNGWT